MHHDLKSWPVHFEPLARGVKRAELRYNDRNFCVGDTLNLYEYQPLMQVFTGKCAHAKIEHVATHSPVPYGYVLLSITLTGLEL